MSQYNSEMYTKIVVVVLNIISENLSHLLLTFIY